MTETQMVINNAFHMFTKLDKIPAILSRAMREMKKTKIKCLEMKTIISKMKTTLSQFSQ